MDYASLLRSLVQLPTITQSLVASVHQSSEYRISWTPINQYRVVRACRRYVCTPIKQPLVSFTHITVKWEEPTIFDLLVSRQNRPLSTPLESERTHTTNFITIRYQTYGLFNYSTFNIRIIHHIGSLCL